MGYESILAIIAALLLGVGGGYAVALNWNQKKNRDLDAEAEKILSSANSKAREMLLEAKNDAFKTLNQLKEEEERKRAQLDQLENRLLQKEENLEKKIQSAEQRKNDLEAQLQSIKTLKEETDKLRDLQKIELEKIASLSKEEAKAILLKEVEETAKKEIAETIKRSEDVLKKEASDKAKFIIADAIQKYAAEVATEATSTIVTLPSDEMKGRIIGKEGRNVSAFEQITGVDVIIDDTPGSLVLSGFDLVRRYIAKIALEKLVADGRIHPARIEEVVEKTKVEVDNLIKELGEKAAFEAGIAGLSPNLIKLLGRLKFRTSHGQNVLKHSLEVAHLAGALAAELGADVNICKKAGLLHDIGKAVDHEVTGHHAIVGKDILKKFDVPAAIIHCVEAHEGELEPKSLEAMIVAAANLIAKARPGAQKDNMEAYIKRLAELESIVNSFSGIRFSYAVQAGSEVRVFVKPDEIDENAMVILSHNIVRKIEKDMQFPAQVKINMIRETRAEAIAK